MKRYQLVTKSGTFYPTLTDLEFSNSYQGEYHGYGREELQGEPRLARFCGPLYNGVDEQGNIIIRYESSEVYATFN